MFVNEHRWKGVVGRQSYRTTGIHLGTQKHPVMCLNSDSLHYYSILGCLCIPKLTHTEDGPENGTIKQRMVLQGGLGPLGVVMRK